MLIPLKIYGLGARSVQALVRSELYLSKSAAPVDLSPVYEIHRNFVQDPFIIAGAGATVVLTVSFYVLRNRWPAVWACWLFMQVLLAPVSGVTQSGPLLVAPRYTYLSCLGWAILLGWLLSRSLRVPARSSGERRRHNAQHRPFALAAIVSATVVLCVLVLLTWQQTEVWRDSGTVFAQVLRIDPNSTISENNLGNFFDDQGNYAEAISHYRQALSIKPNVAAYHFNLGRVLVKQGQYTDAISHYRRSLSLGLDTADVHNDLGASLVKQGKLDASLGEFQTATQMSPGYAEAVFNMGQVYARQGKLEKAVQNYEQVLKLRPNDAEAHAELAKVLSQQGQAESAEAHFRKAIELNPNLPFCSQSLPITRPPGGQEREPGQGFNSLLCCSVTCVTKPLHDSQRSCRTL